MFSTVTSAPETGAEARWYVVWTRSNYEQRVCDELSEKGFNIFLPQLDQWRRRKNMRYILRVPMFPGYLFINHPIDKWSYIKVCNTKGVVKILGANWDRLAAVSDSEVDAIRSIQRADLPTMPHPFLREGERVRVTRGSLANVEGILVKTEPKKGLLVLSIEILRQSVAVKVDCTHVIPA
jgi:transcription antitermination factor NusG